MNEAQITMRGNVASDPTTLTTSKGDAMIRFRFAHAPWRWQEGHGWIEGPTSFFDVVAFRALARHAEASIRKGDPIIVTGRLVVTPWEKDGKSGLNVTVEAEDLGHSLYRGVSTFAKASADDPQRPAAPGRPRTEIVEPTDADTDEYVVRSA